MKNKMVIGFHAKEKEERFLDGSINKWVVLNLRNQSNFVGRVDKIENGIVSLLPFHTSSYDKNMPVEKIVEKGLPRKIKIEEIIGYAPTLRESTENYCNLTNKKYLLDYLKQQIEFEQFIKKQDNEFYINGDGI